MERDAWKERFRKVYDKAVAAYDKDGGRTPKECIAAEDREFLATIGCTPQELYDFVEDWCVAQAPSFDEVLAVTEIRRDYFLNTQKGVAPSPLDPSAFPKGTEEAEGIEWLPRILAKARAKLHGRLPTSLMYGCGGDRPFLSSIGFGLSEFLAMVRDAGDDDQKVVRQVKERAATHGVRE